MALAHMWSGVEWCCWDAPCSRCSACGGNAKTDDNRSDLLFSGVPETGGKNYLRLLMEYKNAWFFSGFYVMQYMFAVREAKKGLFSLYSIVYVRWDAVVMVTQLDHLTDPRWQLSGWRCNQPNMRSDQIGSMKKGVHTTWFDFYSNTIKSHPVPHKQAQVNQYKHVFLEIQRLEKNKSF